MNALREQREKVMLSQAELAQRAGLSIKAISKIENGNGTPWPQTIRKLAKGLGCKLSDLASLRTERGNTNGEQE